MTHPTSARRLFARFTVGLAVILGLVAGGFWVSHESFDELESSSAVINLAGRQRMLAQRIAYYTHAYVHAEDDAEAFNAHFALTQAANLMAQSHRVLLLGDETDKYPAEPPAEVARVMFAEPGGVDWHVRSFLANVNTLLDTPRGELHHNSGLTRFVEDNAQLVLLSQLNQVVDLYEEYYRSKGNNYEQILLAIAISTTALVIFVWGWGFYPIIKRIVRERKKLEKMVQELATAKQEANRVQTMKDQFLAVISHELNTPLYGIMGAIQVLKDADLDEVSAKFVDGISKSSHELERLVGDLLELSRLQGGDVTLNLEAFELVGFIRGRMKVYREQAEDRGITFEEYYQLKEQLVQADPARIGRIVHQLVNNALKFTPRGGRITLHLRALKNAPQGKVGIRLSVAAQFCPLTATLLALATEHWPGPYRSILR